MGYTAIVDYGAGNLMSVTNALNYLGCENMITSKVEELERAERIILPGVGAFPAAMACLSSSGLDKAVKEQACKKPLLGICLGMQMLFDVSYEIEQCSGLGLISGKIRKICTDLKLPHIGWNSLNIKKESPLLNGVENGAYVYFVHSFCAEVENSDSLIATADYGEEVAGIVAKGNVFGCQFHPEKSGETGLLILKNFCSL